MYSCRAELDMELEKMKSKIQLANRDRSNVKALQEAIEAESLLPVMENLRDQDDKFRSVQELQAAIYELKRKLTDIDSFMGCLPIARKIEELQQLVDWNESFGDEKNVAFPKADVEAESGSVNGKETLPVSICTTNEFSKASRGSEDRLIKLEVTMTEVKNMMVQLSDRVRLIEKKRTLSTS